jgi:hypothetical protein
MFDRRKWQTRDSKAEHHHGLRSLKELTVEGGLSITFRLNQVEDSLQSSRGAKSSEGGACDLSLTSSTPFGAFTLTFAPV